MNKRTKKQVKELAMKHFGKDASAFEMQVFQNRIDDLLFEQQPRDLLFDLALISEPIDGAVERVWGSIPVEFIVGIDKDHTAYVTMDKEDFGVLMTRNWKEGE